MTTVPAETKAASVVMTFTVTKPLPANPKIGEIEAVRKAAHEATQVLLRIGGEVTGHITIGKQKFEL